MVLCAMANRPVSTAVLVLVIAFSCNMVGRGVADAFMVFVLPLSEEFGWQRAQVTSVYSVFLVVTGLSAPLTGMLIDRIGARVVYPLGLLLLGSACLFAATLSITAGWGFDEGRKLVYRRVDAYLTPMAVPMKALGDRPATRSFHRPISAYVNGLAAEGFFIDAMLEIPDTLDERRQSSARAGSRAASEIPLFLALRARR